MKDKGKLTRRDFLEGAAKYAAITAVSSILPVSAVNCTRQGSDTSYDVIITGGTVYDGTDSKPRIMDIGIIGDRIVVLGDLAGRRSLKMINAKGSIVTPGFIDVHTHCDVVFKNIFGDIDDWDKDKEPEIPPLPPDLMGNDNYLFQGVTTVIGGNCGYGYIHMNRFFRQLHAMTFGTNMGYLTPHGEIRQALFGDSQPGDLDDRQLALIKTRIAEEMENGAFGFSTGLEYAPGCFAKTPELTEIAKVVQSYGGLYVTHIRNLTGEKEENGDIKVLKALDEAIRIGKTANIPVHLSHLQVNLPWNDVTGPRILGPIYNARNEGLDITGDIHAYDVGLSALNYRLPTEFKTQTGIDDFYKLPENQHLVKEEIEKVFTYLGPDKIRVWYKEKPMVDPMLMSLIDLLELDRYKGKTASDCYLDLVCGCYLDEVCGDPDRTPTAGMPNAYFYEISGDVKRHIIAQDHIFMASDGITSSKDVPLLYTTTHPRSYDNFTRVIKDFVLNDHLMDIQTAIRKMTSLPAEKFKIKERGKIAEGWFADIAVIDLNRVASHATFEEPCQYSDGIKHLIVNGVVTIEDSQTTGQRAGRPLRRT